MTRPWLLVGASALLAACAHITDLDDGLSFAERQARLSAISDWDMSGNLIIDTGERRDRVRVKWEQRGDQLSVAIRPTLVAGSFRIVGNTDRLEIEGRGETRVLDDPEVDLSLELGWWLPVTSLEHWLLGRPDADYPERGGRNPRGTLTGFDQRDWRISYDAYQLAEGLLVPREITMSHESLKLSLTIREWAATGS